MIAKESTGEERRGRKEWKGRENKNTARWRETDKQTDTVRSIIDDQHFLEIQTVQLTIAPKGKFCKKCHIIDHVLQIDAVHHLLQDVPYIGHLL